MFIVEPSLVNNNEHQTRSGLIVAGDRPRAQAYRGVILDVGHHMDEPNAEVGGVILYSAFVVVGVGDYELHVVGQQYALAFEPA